MVMPSYMFSKTTATGVRVPRNTQAPLTLPGMLSTMGHCDQSSEAIDALLQASSGRTIGQAISQEHFTARKSSRRRHAASILRFERQPDKRSDDVENRNWRRQRFGSPGLADVAHSAAYQLTAVRLDVTFHRQLLTIAEDM
jgi:hypothetical protein